MNKKSKIVLIANTSSFFNSFMINHIKHLSKKYELFICCNDTYKLKKFIPNNVSLKNINFNVLQITIPGDFELEVGSKINLEVVKATTSEHLGDAASMKDKYLSGTYLVNAISHIFNEEFIQMVEIKRDSLGVDINAK